jgi:PAS domain S-box-containing protein
MAAQIDLAALVNAIGDAVVVCDAKGAIVYWNPAAERLFGFTQEEALGASLDIIIPQRMQARHWEGYDKTMETGHTKYGHDVLRVPAVGKGDKALSIAFTVAMLYGDGRKPSHVIGVMRDETVRFAEDRALEKRLAELEQQAAAAQKGSTA